jgi:hypothetical protein
MSEKHKSTSPSKIQVTNRRKTSIEEKLEVISRLKKCDQIFYICHDVRLAHSSTHTIHDNANGIKASAKSKTKVFVQQDYNSHIGINHTKNYGCGTHFYCIRNKYI